MSDETSAADLRSLLAGLTSGNGNVVSPQQSGSSAHPAVQRSSSSYPFDFSPSVNQSRYAENMANPLQNSRASSVLASSQFRPPSAAGQGSNNSTPAPSRASQTNQTASLLNLLKFNHPITPIANPNNARPSSMQPSSPQPVSHPATPIALGRAASMDFDFGKMAKPASAASVQKTSNGSQYIMTTPADARPSNPQDVLLQLLNRSKPSQTTSLADQTPQSSSKENLPSNVRPSSNVFTQESADAPAPTAPESRSASLARSSTIRKESPIRIFGSGDDREPTPFEPQVKSTIAPGKESIFTHVDPFEQLAASSPRNAKPKSGRSAPSNENSLNRLNVSGAGEESKRRKRKSNSPARSRDDERALTPGGSEILESIETSQHSEPKVVRSQIEALLGIGAPTNDTNTVAEALNEVGSQVNRQINQILASNATQDQAVEIQEGDTEGLPDEVIEEVVEEQLQEIALEVKEELDKNEGLLESTMSDAMAKEIKDVIGEAAAGNVDGLAADSGHESRDVAEVANPVVRVFQFPARPFVSIVLQLKDIPEVSVREDGVIEVARLKKDFDQVDRVLATASRDFIVYALPRAAGLRIIRQDDGADRQIHKDRQDRIFNVTISHGPKTSLGQVNQAVIATAVSGSVFWAPIGREGQELLNDDALEEYGLIFPPVPSHDDNTSGGQLKTRAKKSSRHDDFFAIGRGKHIQIVFPQHAKTSRFITSTTTLDSEKYFKDRSLRINTGKAGKDFTFSEDDTVIASLDKAGRLRFWNIESLINEANGTVSKVAPIEVKKPILTFMTSNPSEKAWPTSVLFIDKLRPYTKASALRYMVVGMRQNHTLQLWDLGLGKAVQELNFPHDNESDAICSIAYHPGSGIIVLGHPTRNSIYFIHLSAPRYGLPTMSQVEYLTKVSAKDPSLLKVSSTAIMSGIREYSFNPRGQLRSLDLLPAPSEPVKPEEEGDEPVLFELYAMHSKGVTCLSIRKSDLGWSSASRILHQVDAEAEGYINIKDLNLPSGGVISEQSSVNGDVASTTQHRLVPEKPAESARAPSPKPPRAKKALSNGVRDENPPLSDNPPANGVAGNAPEMSHKKKKNKEKRAAQAAKLAARAITPEPSPAPTSQANAASKTGLPTPQLPSPKAEPTRSSLLSSQSIDAPEVVSKSPDSRSKREKTESQSVVPALTTDFVNQELKKIEQSVSSAFSASLSEELDVLYRKMAEEKRVQDAAGAAKQDAILRLVSSTLTDNVDKALWQHINDSIKQEVLPAISSVTGSTVTRSVNEHFTRVLDQTLSTQLRTVVPQTVTSTLQSNLPGIISTAIQSTLPAATTQALQSPVLLNTVSETVSAQLSGLIETQFRTVLQDSITPAFNTLALGTLSTMGADLERRVAESTQKAEVQQREDGEKIEKLIMLVGSLSDTVHTMAAAQSDFQAEILKLQRERIEDGGRGNRVTETPVREIEPVHKVEVTRERRELEDVVGLMREGRFEEATTKASSRSFKWD